MRFSSLAIVCQIASIFVTTNAWAIVDHIHEQSKRFNCNGVSIGFNEFAAQQRTMVTKSMEDKHSKAWCLVVQDLLNNKPMTEEEPAVMFKDTRTTSYKYYKLNEQTRYENYGSYNLRSDYIVAIDGQSRACSVILRRQSEYGDNSRPEANFEFCSIY